MIIKRKCDNCKKIYQADTRDIKRGWGLCCSKSCAASKREKSKPGYSTLKVLLNNNKRDDTYFDDFEDPGDDMYWNGKDY